MRLIYTFAWWLLLPFVVIRLLFLSLRNPDYRRRMPERFGFGDRIPSHEKIIWIHAVSVGETQASLPLVWALQKQFPAYRILVTTVTPTGKDHVARKFNGSVDHRYFPYDLPMCVSRFLERIHPEVLLVMETELWPNLFYQCRSRSIPIAVINARLSERSAGRYGVVGRFTSDMLQQIDMIACRTRTDFDRFKKLGARDNSLHVTGNIKFDVEAESCEDRSGRDNRATLFGNRPIWIAASTHPGEEELVLNAHAQALKSRPDCLLILAPRHPERVHGLMSLIEASGMSCCLRSSGQLCQETDQVYVLDTLGELQAFYSYVDLVFMGGSLVRTGGHNYLEPAAAGRAILTGPHYYNFNEIAEALLASNAALLVNNEHELSTQLIDIFDDPGTRSRMGEAARQFVLQNRGSTCRVMELISPWLE